MKETKIAKEKEVIRVFWLGFWYALTLIVFIVLIVMVIQFIDWKIDKSECVDNARTLIDEPYYDLECFANDNLGTVLNEVVKCSCYYQGEYETIGFGTKSKYFDLK